MSGLWLQRSPKVACAILFFVLYSLLSVRYGMACATCCGRVGAAALAPILFVVASRLTILIDSTIPEHQVYILVQPGIHKSSGKDSPNPRHTDNPRRLGKNSGTAISHATQSPEQLSLTRLCILMLILAPPTHCLICSWENIHAGFNRPRRACLGLGWQIFPNTRQAPARRSPGKVYLIVLCSNHTRTIPGKYSRSSRKGMCLWPELNAHHSALADVGCPKHYVVQGCKHQ